jgi:hypothetical protein
MVTRLLFTFLLLFALRPGMAEASCALADVMEQDEFAESDPDFGGGAVGSSFGFEVLAELTHRTSHRDSNGGQQSRAAKHARPGVASKGDLLSTRPHGVLAARESRTQCPESAFVLCLQHRANPPPA